VEGAFAELVGACAAGGALTAWALWLELSPPLIGLTGALPFAAQVLQLPAAWITRRFGSRRTALWMIALSRQAVLPLAALPFLPLAPTARQAIFLCCALLTSALGVAGNNAWTAWMGDLVPGAVRGRYFGWRSAVCAMAATCSSLAAGLVLDAGKSHGSAGVALAALSLAASVAGAVTTLLLRKQHEPVALPPEPPSLREALTPMRDPRLRRLLAFQVAWSAAGGVALAFYPLHMIGSLRMGFARLALYNAGIAAARMVAAPLWGRTLDRSGARSVILLCALAQAFSPVIWLFPAEGRLWPLVLDAAVSGAAMAGLSLATFSLPIALSAARERSFYVAAVAAAAGLATSGASAAGGALIKVLPAHATLFGQPLVAAQLLFLCGAVGRLGAAALALRIVERRDAAPTAIPAPVRAKLAA
jgi:MFS family permease